MLGVQKSSLNLEHLKMCFYQRHAWSNIESVYTVMVVVFGLSKKGYSVLNCREQTYLVTLTLLNQYSIGSGHLFCAEVYSSVITEMDYESIKAPNFYQ